MRRMWVISRLQKVCKQHTVCFVIYFTHSNVRYFRADTQYIYENAAWLEARVVDADNTFVMIAVTNFGRTPGIITNIYITKECNSTGSWPVAIAFPDL